MKRRRTRKLFYTAKLERVDRMFWPLDYDSPTLPEEVWGSEQFLVQVYKEGNGILRVSVNRAVLGLDNKWKDNVSWEELMEIKRQIGYADRYAVEVYPKDVDIVNKANMRHLWVLPEPLDIGWKNYGE